MNDDYIARKLEEAERRIKDLLAEGNIKRLSEQEKYQLARFYKQRALNRLQTANLIYQASVTREDYSDYGESVSAGYYAMYYIVQGYVAWQYGIKLKEGLRGVHAITLHLILYYLVKTNRLARNLYEEYCKTLEITAETHAFNSDDYTEEAFNFAFQYQHQREQREKFTYFTLKNAEQDQAKKSIGIAEQFVNKILELMEA